MVFRNGIPDISVLGRSFVVSQSCLQVSATLPNISSLEVSTFDPVHRSLSVVRLVFVVDVGQYECRKVMIGLWATQMSKGCKIRAMVSQVHLM